MRRNKLIELRKKQSLTRKQLASELGISEVFVAKIEYGQEKPGRDTLIKFETFYQVPAKVLFPDLFTDRNTIKNDSGTQ